MATLTSSEDPMPSAPGGEATFTVSGRVRSPGAVTTTTLAALPAREVVVQHVRRDRALPERRHTGVLLFDLLEHVGMHRDPGPYPYVNLYLVATGEDGAAVVFSVAELDPAFVGNRVLVVPGDGWRLVAADDRAGARSIRGLVGIDVRHGGAEQTPLPPRAHRPAAPLT